MFNKFNILSNIYPARVFGTGALVSLLASATGCPGTGRPLAATARSAEPQRPAVPRNASVTYALPVRFRLEQQPAGHYFSWETDQTRSVTVRPTPGLIVGKRTEFRIVRERIAPLIEPAAFSLEGGVSFNSENSSLVLPAAEAADAVAVEVTLIIFETDVPPGHLWSPTSPRYRELYRTVLRQPVGT